jgi:hypothetical protein
MRAIKAGRVPASMTEGTYRVDSSELFRVYSPASSLQPADDAAKDRRVRAALLEGELLALRAVLDRLRRVGLPVNGSRAA